MENQKSKVNLRICGSESTIVDLDQVKAVNTPEVEYRKVRAWFREEASKMGLTSAQLAASLAPEEQLTINEFSDDATVTEEPLEAEE